MKLSIETDDASVHNPAMLRALDQLEKYRQNYPDFKITFFFIPWECRYGQTTSLVHEENKHWLKTFKKMHEQGWAKFAIHGLTHIGPSDENPTAPAEFQELTYESAYKRIKGAKDIMEKAELPYLPIFKAPNWAINEEGRKAVKDHDLQLVEDKYYDWNLRDPMPKETEFKDKIIIAHGHVQDGDGCYNGICETMPKLRQLPTDTEFYFLDEAIK